MSCFHCYMGLSHLAVGFCHYLQCGLALVGSTVVFGDLFCLYRVLKYYCNVEYPPYRGTHAIIFLHAVGDVLTTDRTQFSDCTQKLTRQIEV